MSDLDRLADPDGRFAILAMDQRGSLRGMLQRAGRPSTDADLSSFKVDVIDALASESTAVLIDSEYGVGPARAAGVLDADKGLLIASDRSPPEGATRASYDTDRGPAFVAEHGGTALKFLLRWRPDAADREDAIDTVRAVVADCRAYGMPAVIEPLAEGDDPRQAVVSSAGQLAELGPDLLKLEWPGDADGCRELSDVCGRVPWTLLSAGVAYDRFVDRVRAAMDAGACGYIAGRAFWGEAVAQEPADRTQFLRTVAAERMSRLNTAVRGRGRSWREVAGR